MIVQSPVRDKKEAILESALNLIKNNGFHGAPVSLIARNAGVASGTIYHYFPNKEAIILELYDQIKSRMVSVMFGKGHNKKEYRQQFFEGWIALCRYFINNPSSLVFIEQFNSSPFARIALKKNTKGSLNQFNEFFQYGIDKGYLKKIEYKLIASAVFGCIIATAKYHLNGRFSFREEDLCRVATVLWDGIKAQ